MALFNQASKVTNSRPSGIKSVEIPYCFLCRGSGRKKIRHKSRPLFRFYFKLVHPNETQNCYLNFTVNYGFVRHLQKSAICDFAGRRRTEVQLWFWGFWAFLNWQGPVKVFFLNLKKIWSWKLRLPKSQLSICKVSTWLFSRNHNFDFLK